MITWSVRNRAGLRYASGTATDRMTAWQQAGEATIALDEHDTDPDAYLLFVGDDQAFVYPGDGGPDDITFRELIEQLVQAQNPG